MPIRPSKAQSYKLFILFILQQVLNLNLRIYSVNILYMYFFFK
jgi:hypothetical protein